MRKKSCKRQIVRLSLNRVLVHTWKTIDFFKEGLILWISVPIHLKKLDTYPDYRIVCVDKLTCVGNLLNLAAAISRCSNNYGPFQFPEKLILLMILNALEDKPLPVYGKGINVRDWLYVTDHCRTIDLIIHRGRNGEIYNVGGHNEKSNIDIVRLICANFACELH